MKHSLNSNFCITLSLVGILSTLLTGCHNIEMASLKSPPDAVLEKKIDESSSSDFLTKTRQDGEWWELFEDAQLDKFIRQALAKAPVLQEAAAQILRAQVVTDGLKGALFPQIGASADAVRARQSETGLNFAGQKPGTNPHFSQYESSINFSYELDLWGKNRHLVKASLGEVQAKVADAAFARLHLSMQVAQTYFKLQTLYELRPLLLKSFNNSQEHLKLIKSSTRCNLASSELVYRAENDVSEKKKALIDADSNIEIQENLLRSYLGGDFDEKIEAVSQKNFRLPKVFLPENLSICLVSQRPDITSQLWILESFKHKIRVAKTGFYPNFNFSALLGNQSLHLEDLFKSASHAWNTGAALSLPLFEGGRVVANLRKSQVDYNLAVYKYNQMLIEAVKEVLDALTLLKKADRRLQEERVQQDYQASIVALNDLKVSQGTASEFDRLKENEIFLNRQLSYLTSQNGMQDSILYLIKALGGGYQSLPEEK